VSTAELAHDGPTVPAAAPPAVPQPIDDTMVGAALGAAAANVIMQLSRLPVGHGVADSTVDSGRVDKHPIKRLRTTVAYLVIALYGTEAERTAMRQAVNRSHGPVHSAPGEAPPYNAFDPELQLWVAACIYWGLRDIHGRLHGPLDEDAADAVYQYCARLGTTLQVPQDLWPSDRAAFEIYWKEGLTKIEMDDRTRGYLQALAGLGFLPLPVRLTLGRFHRFVTAGFLPPEFRDELQVPWSAREQRAFDGVMASVAQVNKFLPRPVRQFPWNVYLWDARRRIRTGRALV
jgi:uncharacterized protein (DUF2236 family)